MTDLEAGNGQSWCSHRSQVGSHCITTDDNAPERTPGAAGRHGKVHQGTRPRTRSIDCRPGAGCSRPSSVAPGPATARRSRNRSAPPGTVRSPGLATAPPRCSPRRPVPGPGRRRTRHVILDAVGTCHRVYVCQLRAASGLSQEVGRMSISVPVTAASCGGRRDRSAPWGGRRRQPGRPRVQEVL
jgi:hypothetical protein